MKGSGEWVDHGILKDDVVHIFISFLKNVGSSSTRKEQLLNLNQNSLKLSEKKVRLVVSFQIDMEVKKKHSFMLSNTFDTFLYIYFYCRGTISSHCSMNVSLVS